MNTTKPRLPEFGRQQYTIPAPAYCETRKTRSDADEIAELWATIQWLTERLDALDGGGEDKKKRNTKNQ